jgi:hypothetical protein
MLTTVLATALSAFLISGKFNRSVLEFELSRYVFLLESIQTIFVRDLDLGLELDQLADAQAVLERQVSAGQGIVALTLFNAHGQVLAQAGTMRFARAPAPWIARNGNGGNRPWTAETDGALIVGLRLSNNFSQTVGGIALAYSQAPHQALLARMAGDLATAAAVIASGAVLLSFLLSSLLLARTRKALHDVEDDLSADGEGADSGSIGLRFRQVARSALSDIDAANTEILHLMERGKPDGACPPR